MSSMRREPGAARERRARFYDLAAALGELGAWVRLHYVYPVSARRPGDGADGGGQVLPYLDIPFQHASPRMLKLMKRPAAAENTSSASRRGGGRARHHDLRSTFIVGFPGETESEFEELLDWLDEAQLDRVGCFEYSPVEGRRRQCSGRSPVPDELKHERRAPLHGTRQGDQRRAAARRRSAARCAVLVDRIEGDVAIARSASDAPEIDGIVRIVGASAVESRRVCRGARSPSAGAYDLEARLERQS